YFPDDDDENIDPEFLNSIYSDSNKKQKIEYTLHLDVFGPDFVWPSTMKLGARREVVDYIISPEWEPTGEELARNAVGYRRLQKNRDIKKTRRIINVSSNHAVIFIELSGSLSDSNEKHIKGDTEKFLKEATFGIVSILRNYLVQSTEMIKN
ncbi:29876_t:CDS:2, partial [Gigaspora margarita]